MNSAFPVTTDTSRLPEGLELLVPVAAEYARILTPEALRLCCSLERRFRHERAVLLERRNEVQRELDLGTRPDFLPETRPVRSADWHIGSVPHDLVDRRVEITGPVDRRTMIDALSSGANVFVADLADSCSPTWSNVIEGQINLRDAVREEIELHDPESGESCRLTDEIATLVVRPRGWHLDEKHVLLDGKPVSASIFDFALYLFHNANELIRKGSGPYFCLAGLESHPEARLWNDVFLAAQEAMNMEPGSIKCTVPIETVLAAFEMDEILWELREHVTGLACCRRNHLLSFIRKFRNHREFVLPDGGRVTMEKHFLRKYAELLVQTCHRRGAHAIGDLAARIPIEGDIESNQAALAGIRSDKRREAWEGHDGTRVTHPGLVALARDELDAVIDGAHQLDNERTDVWVTSSDLLEVPEGAITEEGLRRNVIVGFLYLESWLRGRGCVPLYHLEEDAATAELSRAQVWQWLRHGAKLDDGRTIDRFLVKRIVKEETDRVRDAVGRDLWSAGRFALAASLFEELVASRELEEFLTVVAYEHL